MASVALPVIFLGGVIVTPVSVIMKRHLRAALMDQDAVYVKHALLILHVKVKWALFLTAIRLVTACQIFMANVRCMSNVIMEMVITVLMVKTIQDRAFVKKDLVLHANPPINVEVDFVHPAPVFIQMEQNATGLTIIVLQEYVVQ